MTTELEYWGSIGVIFIEIVVEDIALEEILPNSIKTPRKLNYMKKYNWIIE